MSRIREPLHAIIAEEIKKKIRDGTYPPESRLPAETDFSAELQVSRATLREALSLLEREGFITRLHGVGSFVRGPEQQMVSSFTKLESMLDLIGRSGFEATARVLESRSGALDAETCATLEIPDGSEGLIFGVLYSANDIPLVCTREYAPLSIFPNAIIVPRSETADLSDFISRNSRRPPVATLTKMKGTLPSEEVMRTLMIDPYSPIIRQRFTLFDKSKSPVGCGYDFFNSSWFEFTLYTDTIRL
jgi:GntR family transcriptional regulator